MASVKLKAYAKINLHLDVVSKYGNGYHEVRTVMQTLSLCDDVEISINNSGVNTIECNSDKVPTDGRNIAWKAADLFFDRCGVTGGADIKITKRIPVAAGMAGGSANAAAVLKGLNMLCGEPLSEAELLEIGGRLGADVPFCIKGGTGYADGTGAELHDFPVMPRCFLAVACGTEGVSTPWAYAELDRLYGDFADGEYCPVELASLEMALRAGDVIRMADNIYNIFESAIEPKRPEVTFIKKLLSESGAVGAMMSGSGPSVFGIFVSRDAAERAALKLRAEGIDAFVAEPVEV